ncbi:MAG: polysaccharide deacetylase family protein [Ignavibacteriales bacterium]|nr:polysaccharide deacetylase family protein [Ignavibacteriales bacterium]
MASDNDLEVKMPGQGNPHKIKVLMYHLITENYYFSRKFKDISLLLDLFRSQMRFLDRWGFTTITFEDYRLFLNGELNLPQKPIIITFDDGYEEIYTNVLPVMREFGMKGVLFIMGDRKIKTSVWDTPLGIPPLQLLNDRQIIELQASGFEIGSHSLSHPQLPVISHVNAWEEISQSRMKLEILLNAPVKTFAYPYGLTNESVKKMVSDAGYDFGCGTYTGPPAFGQDLFEIRRMLMSGGMSMSKFAFRMLTPYQYIDWVKRKIKTKIIPQSKNNNPYSGILDR